MLQLKHVFHAGRSAASLAMFGRKQPLHDSCEDTGDFVHLTDEPENGIERRSVLLSLSSLLTIPSCWISV